jgi:hypothetical protein
MTVQLAACLVVAAWLVHPLLAPLRLVETVGILVHQVLDKSFARPKVPLELPAVDLLLQYKAEIPVDCRIDSSFSLLKSE